jgi:hypothetical protein
MNGVSVSFDAERSYGMKESSRGHRRLLTKRKRGKGGGSSAGGATWRKYGGGGSGHPAGHAAGGDRRRSARRGSAGEGAKGGPVGVAATGPLAWAGPSAQCRFRFKQRFLNQNNFKRSKAGFFLIKNFQINYGFAEN